MEKLYNKLSNKQKSTLPANALFWKRKQKEESETKSSGSRLNNSTYPIRRLFYKTNIKDY